MKKVLVLLLTVSIGYGQYSTPVKLQTITMKNSYKGSSVSYRSINRSINKVKNGYVPSNNVALTDNYQDGYTITSKTNPPRYKGEWKVYDLDKSETDCTATPNVWRTSDVAIYHGDRHPVYLSKNNKLFIWVTKDGQTYRKYIN